MSRRLISQLEAVPGLKLECPQCEGAFSVKRAKLFGMFDVYPKRARDLMRNRLDASQDLKTEIKERRKRLNADKKGKAARITVTSEATNFGQISEHIIPAFQAFPYLQSECRAVFKPVDYIVFRGLAKKGRVDLLTFVDVKTGGGRLTSKQRQVRDCITEGKLQHKVIDQ